MKKTYLMISLAMIGVLLFSVLLCAFIPKNFIKYDEQPEFVTLYYKGETKVCKQGTDDYNKFYKLYKDSFKTSYLVALFNGIAGVKPTTTQKSENINLYDTEKVYIELDFGSKTPSYDGDDTVYEDGFTYIFMEVKQDKGLVQTSFHHLNSIAPNQDASDSQYSYYETRTFANQNKLFNAIEKQFEVKK